MRRSMAVAAALTLVGCSDTGPAERDVADLMKDPASARFRAVRRAGDAVCGEVNGKNSFGSYAGYQRFFAVDGDPPVLEPLEAGAAKDYFGVAHDLRCGSDR